MSCGQDPIIQDGQATRTAGELAECSTRTQGGLDGLSTGRPATLAEGATRTQGGLDGLPTGRPATLAEGATRTQGGLEGFFSGTPGELAGLAPAEFFNRHLGRLYSPIEVRKSPLCGGLESAGVARVTIDFHTEHKRARSFTFVMKELEGALAREAAIYEKLSRADTCDFAPGLLGVDREGARCRLYLESIHPSRDWPWREVPFSRQVLELLAHLHVTLPSGLCDDVLADWDYEESLETSARSLLEFATDVAKCDDYAFLRTSLPALRRLVGELEEVRRTLLGFSGLEPTVIHGDVHPGNVIVTRRDDGEVPLLLDWGRARLGSPLEDVASWLHSLGLWEPEARRRHDTLLVSYLAARGLSTPPGREMRDMYWLAGACNLLSGAILYHLSVAVEASRGPRGRDEEALRAVDHWLRIIRRADACWRARRRGAVRAPPSVKLPVLPDDAGRRSG